MASKGTDLIKALKRVVILNDLDDNELEGIASICREVRINAGTIIMNEDEIGGTMYFFMQGEVNVSKSLTMKIGRKGFENTEKSMVKLNADKVSFFGDMAMFQDEPRSATITASTDCILYEVGRNDFNMFVKSNPDAGVKLLLKMAQTLSSRIRKGNEDILKLTTALSIALSR